MFDFWVSTWKCRLVQEKGGVFKFGKVSKFRGHQKIPNKNLIISSRFLVKIKKLKNVIKGNRKYHGYQISCIVYICIFFVWLHVKPWHGHTSNNVFQQFFLHVLVIICKCVFLGYSSHTRAVNKCGDVFVSADPSAGIVDSSCLSSVSKFPACSADVIYSRGKLNAGEFFAAHVTHDLCPPNLFRSPNCSRIYQRAN